MPAPSSKQRQARLLISVIGGNAPPPEVLQAAEQVGRQLAEHDVVVVCGGLGGVMEAACKGAKSAEGTTVGILHGSDPSEANPYVDIPVCTGMGYARNAAVVKSDRAVIALPAPTVPSRRSATPWPMVSRWLG